MPYLSLPGTAGSYLLAPYRAEYNEPSILDVRIEVDFDDYSLGQTLVGRWSGASAASPWQFVLSATTPVTRFRDAANTQHQIVGSAFTLSTGTRTQLRTTIDIPSAECKFWQRATGTALPSDTGWTQVGTTGALTATEIQQFSGVGIQVGALTDGGTTLPAKGKVFRTTVKKSSLSAGTLILDADPSDPTTWIFA